MSQAYNLNFVPLVDSTIWFASSTAFNNWVRDLSVTVPEAEISTYGLVKKALSPTFTYSLPNYGNFSAEPTVTGLNYYVSLSYEDAFGGVTNYEVATAAAFRQAVHNIEQLRAHIVQLEAVLRNAGLMSV